MRVAALCDVHGNLPALEAVLAEVASLEVDRIVCGGDVVAGPFPRECLEKLVGVEAVFVRGNADRESPRAPAGTWEWIATNLDPLSVAFLGELPRAVALGGVLYCHGSPRDDDEILTRHSSDERFRAALEGVEESLVVGGHTHVQFERVVDGIRFVNAGSVGIPYEGKQGAFWLLVDGESVEWLSQRRSGRRVAPGAGGSRRGVGVLREHCHVASSARRAGLSGADAIGSARLSSGSRSNTRTHGSHSTSAIRWSCSSRSCCRHRQRM